jgi:hypothetical protein
LWNAGGGHKRRIAAMRRRALWWQVHWQNYGYHGCGERGKQKVPRSIQCSINTAAAAKKRRATIAMATAARRYATGFVILRW